MGLCFIYQGELTLESEQQIGSKIKENVEINLARGQRVANTNDYFVAISGIYRLLDLVPCTTTMFDYAICSFLGATILGIDATEVIQYETSS